MYVNGIGQVYSYKGIAVYIYSVYVDISYIYMHVETYVHMYIGISTIYSTYVCDY